MTSVTEAGSVRFWRASLSGVTLVIAHQGASRVHRGNTLDAFREAARLGADWVELDTHLTADGALAVFHDFEVAGMGSLGELGVTDLPDWLPLLDAVLDACGPMGMNIEIKAHPSEPARAAALADSVAAFVIEHDIVERTIVSSFSMAAIDRVLVAESSVRTAWLTGEAWDHARAVGQAADRGHCGLHPYFTAVTPELVQTAHDAGLVLNTWTCDDPDRMRELAACGTDGIITNVPDVARQTLRS